MDLEGVSVARADRVRAQAALAEFFADPGDITSLVAVVPTDPARPPVPALDALVDRAVSIRGEPAALRDEIESAQFAERAASRRLVPEPEVVAWHEVVESRRRCRQRVQHHASLPLFDRAQPERAMARARLAQAEARAQLFQVSLRAQLVAAPEPCFSSVVSRGPLSRDRDAER